MSFGRFLIVCAIVVWAIWYFGGGSTGGSFSDGDIEDIKRRVRIKFEERSGVKVREVALIREAPRKLSGFVHLTIDGRGPFTKSCTATMATNGSDIVWGCD